MRICAEFEALTSRTLRTQLATMARSGTERGEAVKHTIEKPLGLTAGAIPQMAAAGACASGNQAQKGRNRANAPSGSLLCVHM